MRFGVIASARQYCHHLAPVYAALAPEERGPFATVTGGEWMREHHPGLTGSKSVDVWITAAPRDLKRRLAKHPGPPGIHFEHGAGLTIPRNPARIAELTRDVRLFCSPNDMIRDHYRRALPGVRAESVGTARLDALAALPRVEGRRPTVAVSFHWSSFRSLAKSAPHRTFRSALSALAKRSDVDVIGTGHPEVYDGVASYLRDRRIEGVRDFEDVVRRADVYVCDNSSTIYEFAALGRPVILLDTPCFTPWPSLVRFQTFRDVGPTALPETLSSCVDRALSYPDEHVEQREAASNFLFPYRGEAVQRAVDVLRSVSL